MATVTLTAVTPKPGAKFYHGSGHHHFSHGRVLQLPSDVAERLIRDGLVDLPSAEGPGLEGPGAEGPGSEEPVAAQPAAAPAP
jgi:hypothetical protein